MAYTPATTDTTRISGAVVPIASSATSVQLTAGRAHEVTGSAAQTFTAPASPVNGAIVNVKVAEAYTGTGVTMPTGMQQAGVLTAGMDYEWQYDGTGWLIQQPVSYETQRYGRTSVADGGTISHGLGVTPKAVFLTPTNAGTIASATAISSTTITVALKSASLTTAASTQIVNWQVLA